VTDAPRLSEAEGFLNARISLPSSAYRLRIPLDPTRSLEDAELKEIDPDE
jgi:hypothetical protein